MRFCFLSVNLANADLISEGTMGDFPDNVTIYSL